MTENKTQDRFEFTRRRDDQPAGRYTKGAWLLLTITHSAVIPGDFGDDDVHVWTCDITSATGRPLGIEPIDDHTSVGHINGSEARFEYVVSPAEIESGEFAQGDMVPPALRGMIEENFADLAQEVRGL